MPLLNTEEETQKKGKPFRWRWRWTRYCLIEGWMRLMTRVKSCMWILMPSENHNFLFFSLYCIGCKRVCVCDMITMQFLFSILFILYLFPFSICNLLPQKLIWNELNFKVFAIIYSLPLYCIYCVHSHAHTLLFEQPLAENSVGEESIFRLMWLCNNFQFRPITKPFVF